MNQVNRRTGLVVTALGLALAAGCVVTPRGRVVFFPPPPPVVVFHPPHPVFVPPPPVVFVPPPPVVFGPLPGSLVARAEQGDPVAQFTLGSCYANGRGEPQNYVKAVHWYYLSARQGYAPAENRLGVCYYRGLGTPVNYATAVYWYRKAAEQGNAVAQDNLGTCYFNGLGAPRNYSEAARWYSAAAAQGNQTAAAHLRRTQALLGGVPVAGYPTTPPPPATSYAPPPSAAPAPQNPPAAEAVEPSSENQMTVDEIKELSKAGVKADTLTGQIKSTNSKFTQQDIASAQQAGVDSSVIECMKENQR